MSQRLLVFLLFLALLAGCSPTSASTPQLTSAPTSTIVLPSATASPLATATLTPQPSLQTQGPYLLFTRDSKNLILLDANGSGQKHIQFPDDGYTPFHNSVSPDRKWIIYFTGSAQAPYDITLHVLKLSDGTTQLVSSLLAPGFPANLNPVLETMVLGDPPIYDRDCFEDLECRRSLVERELTNNIRTFDWSPDSQSIAFTAQIDGASSDIYIYSLQDATIRRLTSETQNLCWLDWAPNGRQILYEISSAPGASCEGRTLHITDLQGSTIAIRNEQLYKMRWGEVGWLTESIYLFLHPNDTDKPPIYDLMSVNTDTGEFHQIWPYSVDYYAIDGKNQTVILYHRNHESQPATISDGLYILFPTGEYKKISDIAIPLILMQGPGPYPVLANDYEGRIYGIRSDGSIEELAWEDRGIPVISPNGDLFLFREQNELVLYSSTSDEPIRSWTMQQVNYDINWNPDSSGVFLSTDMNLYYLDISSDEPVPLLENCSAWECSQARSMWLP